jgi:hypothetical protein
MSKHNPSIQKRIAQAITREYAWMGVTYQAALMQVAKGEWDDHPASRN